MLGKPKYKVGDNVTFSFNGKEFEGIVYVVDAYGVFEDNTDVHYDIKVYSLNCVFNHVKECYVQQK